LPEPGILWKIDRRILTQFDFISPILIVPLVVMSNWLIGEVVPALAQKHLVYVMLSIAVFVGIFLLPVRRMSWLIPIFYWVNIALLAAVKVFGYSRLGAKRWIELPFVHITIQPSEFVKPALILMLAYLISKNPPPFGGYRFRDFIRLSFFIVLPFALIVIEPDLGTAVVLLLIGFGILFFMGVPWKIWATLLVLGAVLSPLIYTQFLQGYQKQRIISFISEKPSYHVEQSIIAIGSGGWSGKSKAQATQTQMRFLPIATSDFIFAYIVERTGFVGAIFIIGIYILIVMHLLSISLYYDDHYIKVVAFAIALMVFVYMGINIAMTMGLAPVVGVPLPMFSYGGSSFLNFIALFAVFENLLAFRFKEMYDSRGTKSFL
jgi:rod shape determining protein RodA